MNVVDSSAWLEYFADGPNADFFAPAIESTTELIVPTLSVYEVFKRVLQQGSEGDALQATAVVNYHRLKSVACHSVRRGSRRQQGGFPHWRFQGLLTRPRPRQALPAGELPGVVRVCELHGPGSRNYRRSHVCVACH